MTGQVTEACLGDGAGPELGGGGRGRGAGVAGGQRLEALGLRPRGEDY